MANGVDQKTEQTALPLGEGAISPAPAAAPAPVASVAPAAVEPVAAAAVLPAAEPTPVAEAAAEIKPLLTGDKPSMLERFAAEEAAKAAKPEEAVKDAKTPEKPAAGAEAKPDAAAAAAGEKKPDGEAAAAAEAVAAPKPEPVAYTYELPATITMDDGLRGEFHTALDAFRADPAAGVQGLVDMHNREMTRFAEATRVEQHEAFNRTRDGWNKDWMADEQIGGSGHQTAMRAIADMRDLLVSSARPGTEQYKNDMAAFSQFMRITGAGDHPAFGRLLHNASRLLREPQHGEQPTNLKPPPDLGRAPGGRRAVMYDHPRSNQNRQQ